MAAGNAGAACLATVGALTALVGCGDGEERVSPPSPPSPSDTLDCSSRLTDAGDAKPSRNDPRTLVLRLRDLPRGFGYDVEYQEGGVGLVSLGEVAYELTGETGQRLVAARGQFGRGRLPVVRQPGAPPPPPSCPRPATVVRAGALVLEDEASAMRIYAKRNLLTSSALGVGDGAPLRARPRKTRAPLPLGAEAELTELDVSGGLRPGRTDRWLVWRNGAVIGMVSVAGEGGVRDRALLIRLARRQAGYIAAAR